MKSTVPFSKGNARISCAEIRAFGKSLLVLVVCLTALLTILLVLAVLLILLAAVLLAAGLVHAVIHPSHLLDGADHSLSRDEKMIQPIRLQSGRGSAF